MSTAAAPKKPKDTKPADPPKAEEPKKLAPAPTPEELEQALPVLMEHFFPVPGKEKAKMPEKKEEPVAPEKSETPAVEDEPKLEAPAAEPKPKAKEKPEPAPVPPPPPGELVTKRLSDEIVPRGTIQPAPAATPKPDAKPDSKYGPKEQRILTALEHIETTNPDRKGVKDATIRFWNLEESYISKWEKEHPDETFNQQAPEHRKFYDDNEPVVDPDEISDAIAEIKVNKRVDMEIRRVKSTEEKERSTRNLEALKPTEAQEQTGAVLAFIPAAVPELAALMTEKDGHLFMDPAADKRIAEAAPAIREILKEESQPLGLVVQEIVRLKSLPGEYKPDVGMAMALPNGNLIRPHAAIVEIKNALEEQLAAAPPAETMRQGRRFVPIAEMNTLMTRAQQADISPAAREKLISDLQRHYYTVTWDDIAAAAIVHYADRAASRVRRFGLTVKLPSKGGKAPEPPAPPAPKPVEIKPPATLGSSDAVDNNSRGGVAPALTEEQIEKRMFPR